MNRYLSLCLMIVSSLFLISCAYHRYPYLNTDLTQEKWRSEINTNANVWAQGADRWFLTGDANATEILDRNAPYQSAISTMQIRVPDFTKIKTDGAFQVQIFGTYGHNSVYVYGPNEGVREVVIGVRGETLYLNQAKKKPPTCMNRVIIRIGVNNLNCLTHLGVGTVEGIQLVSSDFKVVSAGSGNIYLAGNMNLRTIVQNGRGNITIFGANTPSLGITTTNMGSVNVSGNVGVNTITHHGINDINIIGVNSNNLVIKADGKGKIGLLGTANLKSVEARDNAHVYLSQSNSQTTYAYAYNFAQIGISGRVDNLYVYTSESSRVYGRYLRACMGFVRSRDYSHVNVTASDKIFASATQNATIYFFGEPKVMSQFVSGNGSVIPIWFDDSPYDYPRMTKVVYGNPKVHPRYGWKNGKLIQYKDNTIQASDEIFIPNKIPVERCPDGSIRKESC